MAGTQARLACFLALIGAGWPLAGAYASAEAVDQVTRAALQLDVHPERGAALFAQNCASCHGAEAQGDARRNVPALAAQRFAYLVRQIANFAGAERDSAAMHRTVALRDMRDPQAWVDIAAYLNRIPAHGRAQTGRGGHVALGRTIFHDQCAACHRDDGHGDADGFVPSLRNQHYAYLLGQMHKLQDEYRHNLDKSLVRFLRGFDDEEMSATADYLSRLHGPVETPKKMRNDGVLVD